MLCRHRILVPDRTTGDLTIKLVLANLQRAPAVDPILRNIGSNDENLDRFVGTDADQWPCLSSVKVMRFTVGALRCAAWGA
jgi:hypothetical protein